MPQHTFPAPAGRGRVAGPIEVAPPRMSRTSTAKNGPVDSSTFFCRLGPDAHDRRAGIRARSRCAADIRGHRSKPPPPRPAPRRCFARASPKYACFLSCRGPAASGNETGAEPARRTVRQGPSADSDRRSTGSLGEVGRAPGGSRGSVRRSGSPTGGEHGVHLRPRQERAAPRAGISSTWPHRALAPDAPDLEPTPCPPRRKPRDPDRRLRGPARSTMPARARFGHPPS